MTLVFKVRAEDLKNSKQILLGFISTVILLFIFFSIYFTLKFAAALHCYLIITLLRVDLMHVARNNCNMRASVMQESPSFSLQINKTSWCITERNGEYACRNVIDEWIRVFVHPCISFWNSQKNGLNKSLNTPDENSRSIEMLFLLIYEGNVQRYILKYAGHMHRYRFSFRGKWNRFTAF